MYSRPESEKRVQTNKTNGENISTRKHTRMCLNHTHAESSLKDIAMGIIMKKNT